MVERNVKNPARYSAPVFHFVSAKNFNFCASLRSTGIKVNSLGISIYSSEYKYSTVKIKTKVS